MVRGKEAKAAALVLTGVCMVIYFVQSMTGWPQLTDVGISEDCSILARLSYSFFHAGLPHCLVNCWCLLSIVFIYEVPVSRLAVSYIVAVLYPFASTYTVGLSAVCFCMLGQVVWLSRRKLFFHTWVVSFIVAGIILPYMFRSFGLNIASPDNTLHIYSYVVGLMVGFFNSPAPWQRRRNP